MVISQQTRYCRAKPGYQNGVLESDNDIIHILKPLGFERYEVVEPKKSAASAKE